MKHYHVYLTSTEQLELLTTITSVCSDERGHYVTTAHQIFHPQGGGQAADVGTIKTESGEVFEVMHTAWSNEEIRHYGAHAAPPTWLNQSVMCQVDKQKRFENAKLHTAGHLIAQVVEGLQPRLKARKGHHFSGESYVEFEAVEEVRPVVDKPELEAALERALDNNHPIYIKMEESSDLKQSPGKTSRTVQIEGFCPLPCGGTHVDSLAAIGKIHIISQKWKSQRLRVRYSVVSM